MDHEWGFLRPWCAPVYHKLALRRTGESKRVPTSYYRAIAVDLSTEEPAELRAVRDALVLLALVARADFSAYKHALTEYCALDLRHHGNCSDEDAFRQVRFLIRLDSTNPWSTLHGLFADMDAPPSAHFVTTVRTIAGDSRLSGAEMGPLEIPVKLVAGITDEQVGTLLARLGHLAVRDLAAQHNGLRFPVAMASGSGSGSGADVDCVFVIEPVKMELAVTDESAPLVKEVLRAHDVPLGKLFLWIGSDGVDSARTTQTRGSMFANAFCGSDELTGARPVIGKVHTSWTTLSNPAPVARLCSALAETRTTNTLRLWLRAHSDLIEHILPHLWTYLGYAIFSQHARKHSLVRHLYLSEVDLLYISFDALAQVVQSADPGQGNQRGAPEDESVG